MCIHRVCLWCLLFVLCGVCFSSCFRARRREMIPRHFHARNTKQYSRFWDFCVPVNEAKLIWQNRFANRFAKNYWLYGSRCCCPHETRTSVLVSRKRCCRKHPTTCHINACCVQAVPVGCCRTHLSTCNTRIRTRERCC